MPGYVTKMLQRFRPQYLLPGHRPAKTPGRYIPPSYTSEPQVICIDKTEKLSPTLITELQAIIGTLLYYYARAVDPTLLTYQTSWHHNKPSQLNASSRQQTAPSATAALITRTLCSTTPATWSSTHSPTHPIFADHTPDRSRALYSFSATKTIPPESMDPSTCSPR
jgi:hypothetical protein